MSNTKTDKTDKSDQEETFKGRVESIVLRKFNGNWKAFASALDKPYSTISEIKKGRIPYSATVSRIGEVADVSTEWLLTGDGPMKTTSDNCLNETEHVLIPRYDIFASAGTDTLDVFEEHVLDHTAFRRDWLVGTMRLDPEKLAIIMVDGDSMIPTLQPGDFILIDLREAGRLRSDAVYVVRVEGALLVKRIQVGSDGGLDVWSDNPSYKPWTYTAEQSESLRVKIVGRVVWAGKRM